MYMLVYSGNIVYFSKRWETIEVSINGGLLEYTLPLNGILFYCANESASSPHSNTRRWIDR